MSRDDEAKNVRLFDRRVVERNIKKGLVTRKDYEKHLKSLSDVGANIASPEERIEDGPDDDDIMDEPDEQPADHKEHATSFCVQIAQVGVDEETGQVFLYEMVTAVDTAEILDPLTHQAQVEGGVVMGIGGALTEDLGIQDGQVAAAHMGEYKLPSIADMAALRTVLLPPGKGVGPCNIKAIGELTNVPTGAAIANAVADAVGVRIDSLPITAEKVYQALQAARGNAG